LRIISRKALRDAEQKHRDLQGSLDVWYRIAKKATWTSLDDIRKTWRGTDAVGDKTVFNIKGNRYRLTVKINFHSQTIFLKAVLTHAEYDREGWKQ
jgi:mRNA interferase HigB